MNQNKKVAVSIDIQAKLDNAQRSLEEFQKQLQQLKLGSNLSREFSAVFSSLEKELDKLRQKTISGELSLVDAHSAEQTISKIDNLYSSLIHKLEKEGVASAGLKKDQAALGALLGAQKEYTNALRETEKTQESLNRKLEQEKKKKEELAALQRRQTVVSEGEYSGQRLKVSQQKKSSETAAKKLLEAEQALEQKVADSKGAYSMSQKDEKGSSLRKTKAYKEYKVALEEATAAERAYREEREKLESYTTEAKQAEAMKEVEEAISDAEAKLTSFNNEQAKTAKTEAFAKIKKDLQEIKDIDWKGLGIDLDSINNIEDLEQALSKLKTEAGTRAVKALASLKDGAKKTGDVIEDFGEDVHIATRAVEEMDESARNSEAFAARIKSFLGLSGAAQLLKSALRDAMQTIKELDATMTEMAVVTDLTVGDYWDQLPEYSKQASDLGVSINSAYKAATLYYQQGLKSNEVTKISAETLKMARIAGLSAEDATNKMTAALRGFNMELNETSAQRISDVYSELAAITASDVDEISSAMTKTASIAANAGMEFETTAAFLSQIIETTRESAETAGTAMKTVIARFQELKKDPTEIGEVEGEIVDANKIETALRSVGVSLRDSAGQFRELDDVFLELSSKWNTLDTNTQRYIATIAAGSRQQSRFIAMMSDYERTQQLVTAANTSAGASNKQFEKTLDSLDAKLEKLKNAWHEFTMSILESDLVKFGVDALTKFLEIINKATSSIGGLGNSLSKIITILGVFKLASKIFDKIRAPMISFFADVVKEAGIAGYKSGETFAKKTREGANAAKDKTQKQQSNGLTWDSVGLGGVGTLWNLMPGQKKKNKAAATEWLNQAEKEGRGKEALEQDIEKWTAAKAENIEGADENLEKAQKNLEEYHKQEVIATKGSAASWKEVGKGISQAGSAVTALGVGMSMFGGILSSLGLEEAGEAFSGVGQIITIVGGALTALGAIVPAVTSVLSAAGITLQASFWPILVIGLAIAALVATVAILIASFKALKAATPEGKLEAAKEKAEGLSDAAQQAADAFDQLNDSINSISDKYAELDDMVQGTEAWRDAVREVNKQIMELIEQYPELARFIENTDGVLKIDFEKKAVQEVLDKYESRMMTTQAAAQLGNAQVVAAETDVAYSKVKTRDFATTSGDKWGAFGKAALSAIPGLTVGSSGKMEWNWADLGLYAGSIVATPIATLGYTITDMVKSYNNSIEGDTRELNEKVAQAMNEGIITSYDDLVTFLSNPENGLIEYADMAGEIWDNEESFKAYREALEAETNQRKATTAALFASAQSIANTSGFTVEDNKIMAGIEDALDINLQQIEADLAKVKWHQTGNLSSEQYTQLTNAVKAQYGENAKIEGKKIKYYDADNNLQTVAIKDVTDRLITQMASDKAVNDTKKQIEAIPILRRQFAGNSDMMALLSGETTLNQLKKLKQVDFSKLTESQINALKNAYGDNYEKILQEKLQNELDGFKTAERKLKGINISKVFGDVSAEAANALANIATNTGWGGKNNFVKAFQTAQGSLGSQSDKNQFTALLGSMVGKEGQRESWENLEKDLKEQNLWNEEVAKFIVDAIEKTGATYSESHLTAMGVSDELYSRYQQAVILGNKEVVNNFHKTFKKWKEDYDVANDEGKKAEHELKTAISDALTKSAEEEIDELEALTDAVNEANEKMVQAIQKQIDEQRQARDNAKEEENLNDLRNRIAYLKASGASPLELMQAEEELAAAEESYSDKLVDQSIAKLEDANEKAASQREEQINLLRSQLEFWKETQGFKDEVDRIFEESRAVIESGGSIRDTELWKLLGYDKLSEYEQRVKATELNEQIGKTIRTSTKNPLVSKGATNTTGATTAVGGATSGAESIRFNKDLLTPTQQVIKEEGESGVEIARRRAIEKAGTVLSNNGIYTESGLKGLSESGDESLNQALADYKATGGTLEEFAEQALARAGEIRQNYAGVLENVTVKGLNAGGFSWGEYDGVKVTMDGNTYQLQLSHYGDFAITPKADRGIASMLNDLVGGSPTKGQIAMVDKIPYMYIAGGGQDAWFRLDANDRDDGKDFAKKYLAKLQGYKTGGLADFTGPAWLDGTKSRPEYVLNSAQTERFFSLVDILEGLDTSKTSVNSSSGDNHFEIEINVEKLENDYDVEQLADKIRRMIYDDATYRNVNAVGFIR